MSSIRNSISQSLKNSSLNSSNSSNSSKLSSFNLDNLSGSSPRSSEGIYNNVSDKASSIFKPKSSSKSRLLSVPSESTAFLSSAAKSAVGLTPEIKPNGSSFFRYLGVFVVLGFLILNFFLFMIKPVDHSISQMYDPLINIFYKKTDNTTIPKKKVGKNNVSAVKKLSKALDEKKPINNIDGKKINPQEEEHGHEHEHQATRLNNTNPEKKQKPYKKIPVIPEPDNSASRVQASRPTSKSGHCYIGEDRGFRSCIEVGEGDVCMSGDIFPTRAICVNPNLRE